jgi:hypothetical protein
MNASTPSFAPGPWLGRRYAARAALEQKLLQERVRYSRQRQRQEELAPERSTRSDHRGSADWNPFAVLLGVLLGGWFSRR